MELSVTEVSEEYICIHLGHILGKQDPSSITAGDRIMR